MTWQDLGWVLRKHRAKFIAMAAALAILILYQVLAQVHPRALSDSERMQYLHAQHQCHGTSTEAVFDALWDPAVLWMSYEEARLIASFLHPTHRMLEWGSGGSTVVFSQLVQSYFSVEHSAEWFDRVKEMLAPSAAPHVSYERVPCQCESDEERPSRGECFRNYIDYPHNHWRHITFDRVLVDGRARPQCALAALGLLRDPPNGVVFVHDFWNPNRAYYREVLFQFYDEIASVTTTRQTVIALRPKPDALQHLADWTPPEWWD